MKKVLSILASILSVLLLNDSADAHTIASALPLNMVIGIPELIIISLFASMAITILIVVIKKVIHK